MLLNLSRMACSTHTHTHTQVLVHYIYIYLLVLPGDDSLYEGVQVNQTGLVEQSRHVAELEQNGMLHTSVALVEVGTLGPHLQAEHTMNDE